MANKPTFPANTPVKTIEKEIGGRVLSRHYEENGTVVVIDKYETTTSGDPRVQPGVASKSVAPSGNTPVRPL